MTLSIDAYDVFLTPYPLLPVTNILLLVTSYLILPGANRTSGDLRRPIIDERLCTTYPLLPSADSCYLLLPGGSRTS